MNVDVQLKIIFLEQPNLLELAINFCGMYLLFSFLFLDVCECG